MVSIEFCGGDNMIISSTTQPPSDLPCLSIQRQKFTKCVAFRVWVCVCVRPINCENGKWKRIFHLYRIREWDTMHCVVSMARNRTQTNGIKWRLCGKWKWYASALALCAICLHELSFSAPTERANTTKNGSPTESRWRMWFRSRPLFVSS